MPATGSDREQRRNAQRALWSTILDMRLAALALRLVQGEAVRDFMLARGEIPPITLPKPAEIAADLDDTWKARFAEHLTAARARYREKPLDVEGMLRRNHG